MVWLSLFQFLVLSGPFTFERIPSAELSKPCVQDKTYLNIQGSASPVSRFTFSFVI